MGIGRSEVRTKQPAGKDLEEEPTGRMQGEHRN